ncbi:DUF4917 family protein [Shewanella algae]|uniref:DUF4917 family protein n=1 Tax=Shewanella algae TaxID=38313 RepID=UPI000E33341F|nr:DUF4917 family protein [Shewanella algae]AXQ15857.1 hypothetical protein BS332_17945 [Shewanella algae]QXP18785.1 DUF4917 family protein [Shewanella algae]QXP28347.1 DUF4917 family protein [Shewanella algae]QXP34643.1 DUF4917 family protein [Shewanella algae]QXP37541.1 DUF4917 family protein [Shewanella algae]
MPVEIHNWRDICDDYTDGLLLGNGASIAVDGRFTYASLFQAAGEAGYLTAEVQNIFERFGNSTDFEYVLRKLWQAKQVNEALGIEAVPLDTAYQQVRTALVETVRAIHLTYEEAMPHLPAIYEFMRRFNTVLSLNYDLIVYWAALRGNDDSDGSHQFKDCMIGGVLDEEWPRLREPLRAKRVTLFFYPHGNLALARSRFDEERKIEAVGGTLLDTILNRWQNGRYIPIFVSEGRSEEKRQAIQASQYLSEIYFNAIPSVQESLVIYGWNMGDQEAHILHQLRRAKPRRVAVSVFTGNPNYQRDAQRIEDKLHELGIEEVRFYDSRSDGCWNNQNGVVEDL